MTFGTRVIFEPLRTVAFGGIGAAYAPVGSAMSHHARLVSFFNSTDADLIISLDNVNDHVRVAAGTGQVFDLTANKVKDDGLFVSKGTIFFVKRAVGAPSVGNFWIQVMAAHGGV